MQYSPSSSSKQSLRDRRLARRQPFLAKNVARLDLFDFNGGGGGGEDDDDGDGGDGGDGCRSLSGRIC